jgi:hypothetical protein
MKRIVSALLCILMIFAFAGCGKLKNAIDSAKDIIDDIKESTGNNLENNDFEYDEDFISAHLGDEYLVKYRVTYYEDEESEATVYEMGIAKNSEGLYVGLGKGTEFLYVKEGDGYAMCFKDTDSGVFKKYGGVTLTEEEVLSTAESVLGYMSIYSGYSDTLEKVGSATICGRSCEHYRNNSYYWGTGGYVEYYIDKETGVCLKYGVESSLMGKQGMFTYECLEFKLSGVQLPAYTE